MVTPHASFLALDVAPQQAFANITALRSRYPGVYGADGFFDAVNPATGAKGAPTPDYTEFETFTLVRPRRA